MTRFQALSIYAFCIILTGVILLILAYNPSRAIQYMVAVGMFVSAVFAFIMAKKSKDFQIPLKYHGIHAIGMLVYGLAILFYTTNIQLFIETTTFYGGSYGRHYYSVFLLCLMMCQDNEGRQNHHSIFYISVLRLAIYRKRNTLNV